MTVTDTLPAGVTFDSATPSQGTLLAVGRHRHVLARARSRTAQSASVHDQGHAAVRGLDHEPGERLRRASATRVPANNSASATTTVDPVADLSITKSDSPDPVSSGPAAHLHARRPNAGPSSATGVTVTDTLPAA